MKHYWLEYAVSLPAEEKAIAARMKNASPKLLNDTTFEIGVDNDMVAKYMMQMLSSIENYMREKLHNRKITMTVRVLEEKEVVRAYNHVERYQLMIQKNPKLQKLREVLKLELT